MTKLKISQNVPNQKLCQLLLNETSEGQKTFVALLLMIVSLLDLSLKEICVVAVAVVNVVVMDAD